MNITILGAGAFGLALSLSLSKYQVEGEIPSVTVWTPFIDELTMLMTHREHKEKLPEITIPEAIKFTSEIDCCKEADIVIFGIPSNALKSVAKLAAPHISEKAIVISTSKGIETDTLQRMSEIISGEIKNDVVVLSGPSHAEEVAKGVPTSVVVACENRETAKFAQKVLNNKEFRVYVNSDVIGCELGGAFKNIIALGAGICDGLKLGDNAKAALITRGLAEITRLGIAMGARHETFAGLTGLGDLNVTCYSMHSRNRRAGILIGSGMSPEDAVKKIGTVEGFHCCKVAKKLIEKYNVRMPVTSQVYKILLGEQTPKNAIEALMTRPTIEDEADYLNTYK